MTSESRAQRLVDEFEEVAGKSTGNRRKIRHGIAAVLRHIADTESESPSGAWYAVPTSVLEDMAAALTAPSLLDRAVAGDAAAARQFLHQAGFTDERGQWLPQYQPVAEDDLDLYLEQ
jgi:hypothetical protein